VPVYCDDVRAIVRLVGIENVSDNYLVIIHRRADTRQSSLDAIVLGDLMRPDETPTVPLDREKIAAPIGKVDCVTIHRRSSGNIATRGEHPFGAQAVDVGRTN
jgi:hypothetical protein